jgi:hypothetical protein
MDEMFYGTLPQDTQDFTQVLRGVGRNIVDIGRGVSYYPYDLLGAPVDIINMALQPVGLGSERPVLGSDYLRNIAQSLGYAQPSTGSGAETAGRLGAAFVNPAAGARAVGQAGNLVTRGANLSADRLVQMITGNPQATAPRVLEETAMPFMQAVAPKPIGSGLIKIKQDAKQLSVKDFLDKYVTEDLPQHFESGNFPSGVVNKEPHEFLPPQMLDPSEWDDWSDRWVPGAEEKIKDFREALKQGAEFPPILVHSRKGDFPVVEDGHHRMAAFLDENYKTVPVSFDISSLIKIWKEENKSDKKLQEIYKDYTQGLLSEKNPSPDVTNNFLNEVQKFPSDYNEVVPQDAIVKASQLVPTQEKVSKSAVELYKSGQGSMGDLPADVVFDKETNQYLIVDGHHRIAAMLESGVDNIPVQIIGEK